MIEAYFDGRTALITGASQYDTGQRIRLNGLPSPEELGEADEFLSGDLVAVQAHFSYRGDAQAQVRLAQWDDENYCWVALIPDEYLTRSEEVSVHVVVSHGVDSTGSRNKTRYEGVFIPTRRPAPNNVVSDDQLDSWDGNVEEINLVLASAQTAIEKAEAVLEEAEQAESDALGAVSPTSEAARNAASAYNRAEALEDRFGALTVYTNTLAPGADATASLDGNALTFGVPKGVRGDQGPSGSDGPSDVDIAFDPLEGVLTITMQR